MRLLSEVNFIPEKQGSNLGYLTPELYITLMGDEEKERVKQVLLWVDEYLPMGVIEREGWQVKPLVFSEPRDAFITPHPDDFARLKAGKRKRITELPEWQIYFLAETGKRDHSLFASR